jgi:hypothetical protein
MHRGKDAAAGHSDGRLHGRDQFEPPDPPADYFAQGLVSPVDKVYVATIQAGAAGNVAMALAIWAVPAAIIQWLGGPARQLGILLATGLLIPNPMVGWGRAQLGGCNPCTRRSGEPVPRPNCQASRAGRVETSMLISGTKRFSINLRLFSPKQTQPCQDQDELQPVVLD